MPFLRYFSSVEILELLK